MIHSKPQEPTFKESPNKYFITHVFVIKYLRSLNSSGNNGIVF